MEYFPLDLSDNSIATSTTKWVLTSSDTDDIFYLAVFVLQDELSDTLYAEDNLEIRFQNIYASFHMCNYSAMCSNIISCFIYK